MLELGGNDGLRGQKVSVQAGAGIVADSDPDREYEETMNKAEALAVAVEMAENETRFLGKNRVSPEEEKQ